MSSGSAFVRRLPDYLATGERDGVGSFSGGMAGGASLIRKRVVGTANTRESDPQSGWWQNLIPKFPILFLQNPLSKVATASFALIRMYSRFLTLRPIPTAEFRLKEPAGIGAGVFPHVRRLHLPTACGLRPIRATAWGVDWLFDHTGPLSMAFRLPCRLSRVRISQDSATQLSTKPYSSGSGSGLAQTMCQAPSSSRPTVKRLVKPSSDS